MTRFRRETADELNQARLRASRDEANGNVYIGGGYVIVWPKEPTDADATGVP